MLLVPIHLLLALCEAKTVYFECLYITAWGFLFLEMRAYWPMYLVRPKCSCILTPGSSLQAMMDGELWINTLVTLPLIWDSFEMCSLFCSDFPSGIRLWLPMVVTYLIGWTFFPSLAHFQSQIAYPGITSQISDLHWNCLSVHSRETQTKTPINTFW